MKVLLISSLLALSFYAVAGDKGNGGDVIVCPNSRPELLDLFQGRESWDLIPKDTSSTVRMEIIKEKFSAFKRIDELAGTLLEKRSLELNTELTKLEANPNYKSLLVKLTDNELVNIADEGVAEIPQDCVIKQAASQVSTTFPGEVKFVFQRQLWEKMDEVSQVSLILHEAIYEYMISLGVDSSRTSRFFNAALHAGRFDTLKGYLDVSKNFNYSNLKFIANESRTYGRDRNCIIKGFPRSYGETYYIFIEYEGKKYKIIRKSHQMIFEDLHRNSIGVCK